VYGTVPITAEEGAPLTLTSPNGGEVLTVGTTQGVSWTSAGPADSVSLSWSCDGGITWTPIEDATVNDGEYSWICPGPPSGGCLVRVSRTDGTLGDSSDRAFTVIDPVAWLTVTPESGDVGAGETLPLQVAFDATGLPDGDYLADILFESTGGDAVVPVTLRIRPTGVDDRIPRAPVLFGSYPNPFNPSTRVAFSVPEARRVRLTVYDIAGRVVRVLADQEFGAGHHAVAWDGTGMGGARAASGVYFLTLESGSTVEGVKLVLLK